MKNLLSILLVISVLSFTSCSKDNNASSKPSSLKGVQTGEYVGIVSVAYNIGNEGGMKLIGGQNEKVLLKHTSGNIYTVVPITKDLPSVKLEFKKSGQGYGIYIVENQKCKYGNFEPVPMSSFGVAFSGVYNPISKTLNLGYYSDYYPIYREIAQMGGIIIENENGDAVGYIQMNISKR